ncbi:MAG: exonuclease SbcCD subunit D [Acidobacteriota bacterium]
MRILHTADWHVGRTIRGRSRALEHRQVLKEIVAIAQQQEVDLAIVAGDLFDTAMPSPESEKIVYRTLLELADTGAHVVLVSGNHDNPRRLQAVKPLLDRAAQIHTGALLARPGQGGVIKIETRFGERAGVALVPFLSQRQIITATALMQQDADEQAQTYAQRCARVLTRMCESLDSDSINFVVAHLMVTGAQPGGGERSVHTGFDYEVPSLAFKPAQLHYVALGHIHKAQQIPATCPVWYCGSPLQLDFGDTEEEKCVLVVEASSKTPALTRRIPLSSGRRLRTVQGSLAALEELAESGSEDYLRVLLDEPGRAGLAEEVRELLPNAVEVRLVESEGEGTPEQAEPIEGSPRDFFAQFLKEKRKEEGRLLELFDQILEEVYEAQKA